MKKIKFLSSVAIATAVLFSCGGQKEATKVSQEQQTKAIEIVVPFSTKEYQSDEKSFRTKSMGTSPDMATAKKIALLNAKTEIAGLINTTIKAVTDQYVNQTGVSDRMDFEQKFEELTRAVVKQELNDVRIIGEKILQKPDGKYEYWVAIEMNKDALLNKAAAAVTKNEKLRVDFDKNKYEKVFNEEMKKFEQTGE